MDKMEETKDIQTKLEKYRTTKDPKLKNTMSVPEMRRLLGVKKDRKLLACASEFFETKIIDGKMRVDIESFEKWYANQVKHKKVTGEKPGTELLKTSYSFQDAANLLSINSTTLYGIWKEENLPTVTVDFAKRIPIDVFERWYEGQIRYEKVSKFLTLTELEEDYISLDSAAKLLGITREKLSMITRTSRFKDDFEIRVYENKKWISKKSFQQFLNAQSVYQVKNPVESSLPEKRAVVETKAFISRQEAAALAGVTSVTITKWVHMDRFLCVGAGRVLRINREEFLAWLKEYREGGE